MWGGMEHAHLFILFLLFPKSLEVGGFVCFVGFFFGGGLGCIFFGGW